MVNCEVCGKAVVWVNKVKIATEGGEAVYPSFAGFYICPACEKKVKETGVWLAIHNHGPDNPLYASPLEAFDLVKGMDQRMGLCVDIGRGRRAASDVLEILAARDRSASPPIAPPHGLCLMAVGYEPVRPSAFGVAVDVPWSDHLPGRGGAR